MNSGAYKQGVNYWLKADTTFRVLGDNDVLRSTDLCRPIIQDNASGGGWDTTFKAHSWDGVAWHLVGDELFAWVGLTLKTYKLFRWDIFDFDDRNDVVEISNSVSIIEAIHYYRVAMAQQSYEIIRIEKRI